MLKKIKIPLLIFVYTAVVLAALFCICILYQENAYLKQDLQKSQEETTQLKEELVKINRFSEIYRTSPQIVAVVLRESEKYEITPTIMLELIKTESDFNPQAVSKFGARGLCQIRPVTAKELSQELKLNYGENHLFDTNYNIRLGTYYLAKLLQSNNGDYHRALTAYNRGPRGLEIYMKNKGTAISRYSQRINSKSRQLALQIAG